MSTLSASVTPSGTEAEPPWPTSSNTVMCSHTRRLGLISPDATWAASSSRIAAESLSSRKRLLIYPEGVTTVRGSKHTTSPVIMPSFSTSSRLETSSSMTTSMVLYSRFVDAYSPLTWVDAFFSWNVPV